MKLSDTYRDAIVNITHHMENSYHNAGKKITVDQASHALGYPLSRIRNAVTAANKSEPELVESFNKIVAEMKSPIKRKKKIRKPLKRKFADVQRSVSLPKPQPVKKDHDIMVFMGNASAVMDALKKYRG